MHEHLHLVGRTQIAGLTMNIGLSVGLISLHASKQARRQREQLFWFGLHLESACPKVSYHSIYTVQPPVGVDKWECDIQG